MFSLYFYPKSVNLKLLAIQGEVELLIEVKPFAVPQEDRMWAIRNVDNGLETLAFWYELEVRPTLREE